MYPVNLFFCVADQCLTMGKNLLKLSIWRSINTSCLNAYTGNTSILACYRPKQGLSQLFLSHASILLLSTSQLLNCIVAFFFSCNTQSLPSHLSISVLSYPSVSCILTLTILCFAVSTLASSILIG